MKVLEILATLSLVYVSGAAQNIYSVLVATSLRSPSGVTNTVIFRLSDGQIMAKSAKFNVDKTETASVAQGFSKPSGIIEFTVAGVPYKTTRADSRIIYGENGPGGIVCGSAIKNGVCGVYTGSGSSFCSIAANTVDDLATLMCQLGM